MSSSAPRAMPATSVSPRSRHGASTNCRRSRRRLDWSLYARGGAGYDDNVALRSESIDGSASGEDDAFAELLGSASVSFGQHWHVDAAAALLDYIELDEFDQGVLSLGARRGFALDGWYLEAGGYGTQLTLGHDVFERSAAAGLRATRSFSGGGLLQAQFRATAVDGEGDFSGLSGARAELGVNYDWSWQAWSFGAYTRAELNDSEDDVFASRWVELGGLAEWALSPRWTFSAGRRRASHATPAPRRYRQSHGKIVAPRSGSARSGSGGSRPRCSCDTSMSAIPPRRVLRLRTQLGGGVDRILALMADHGSRPRYPGDSGDAPMARRRTIWHHAESQCTSASVRPVRVVAALALVLWPARSPRAADIPLLTPSPSTLAGFPP